MTSYKCRVCEKSVPGDNLRVHISLLHFNYLPFNCPKCSFKCHVDYMMANHFLERGHGDHQKPIEPVECPPYLTTLINQIIADSTGTPSAVLPESLENLNLPTVATTALDAVAVEPESWEEFKLPTVTTKKTTKAQVVPVVVANNSGTVESSSSGSPMPKPSKLPFVPFWIRGKTPSEDKSDHSALSSSNGSAKVPKPQRQQEDEIVEPVDIQDDCGKTPVLRRKTEQKKSKATGVVLSPSNFVETRKILKVKPKTFATVANKTKSAEIREKKITRSAKKEPICRPYEGIYKKEIRKELLNGKIMWTCKRCRKSFDSRHGASSHLNTHRPPRFACCHCGTKFSFAHNQRSHSLVCPERNSKKSSGKAAVRFSCDHCELDYSQRSHLHRHVYAKHPETVGRFKGQSKRFGQRGYFTRHSHSRGNVRLSCDQCNAKCSGPDRLRVHKQLHHSQLVVRKFECPHPQCRKTFGLKSSLHQHMFVHGNTIHSCDKCPAEYRHRRDLTTHKRKKHPDE